MSVPLGEYELEALPELESEFEGGSEPEWETELEGEYESEEFFRRLAGLARRATQSPALRRVGLTAARSALQALPHLGAAVGGRAGPRGAALGSDIASTLGRHVGSWLPQSELEGEWEWEGESEVNPLRRVYPDALMEHLGHAAAEAESEAEAEAFIGALVPLAASLAPRVAPAVLGAAPQLIQGLSGVARTLRRSPATRPLVRTLPTIARQAVTTMARQAQGGRPVPPTTAVRILARQAARTLGDPRQAVQAYQRSRALDQRHHRSVGPAAAAIPAAARPAPAPAGG